MALGQARLHPKTLSIKTMKILFIFSLLAFLNMPIPGHTFSAVAIVPGHATTTLHAGWNWPTQKEADKAAIDGCRAAARESGIANLANKCRVDFRQKGVGAGAITCGKDECAYAAGYATRQAAVDAAYKSCAESFKDCRKTNITNWWDEAGYPKPPVKVAAGRAMTCSPPAGKVVRSKTQCTNGDCLRTFENGCQVRFQAKYCHDPVSGKWDWKPDGC
jgi:hypothetical protein